MKAKWTWSVALVVILSVGMTASGCYAIKGHDHSDSKGTVSATAAQRQPVAQQTQCPVMGGAINKDIYADYEGRRVYFCCPACVEAFKKDPEKYMKVLDEQLNAAAPQATYCEKCGGKCTGACKAQ